jgi:adenylate cyclase
MSTFDKELPSTGFATLGVEAEPFLFEFSGLLRNISLLEKTAAGRGLFTIKSERDGIVRRVPMILRAQGAMMPSLSLEILKGRQRHPDGSHQIRQGRHQKRRGPGTSDSDR